MKKILLLALAFCFVVSGLVYASPVGNPAKPLLANEGMPFSAGAEFDFVFERELDVSDVDMSVENLNIYAAKLAYTLEKRAELYCLLGAANGELSIESGGVDLSIDTETAFAWGIGATVFLYEFDNGIRLGVDGNFRNTAPSLDEVDVDLEYSEWQIALGVSKQIDQFVPYGGIKYSDVKAELTVPGLGSEDTGSDNIFGIFVGCDFLANENISVGIEGRFIDETALAIRGMYRF